MADEGRISENRATNFRSIDSITVTIGVGRQQEKFTVPKACLADTSNILSTANEKDLAKGKVEELKTVSGEDFNLYVNWLRDKSLPTETVRPSEYDLQFRLYLLSQHLRDNAFRDAVLDAIIAKFNHSFENTHPSCVPEFGAIKWVFVETDENCILRELVACMCAKRPGQGCMSSGVQNQDFPKAFLEAFIDSMLKPGEKSENISDEEAEWFKFKQDGLKPPLPNGVSKTSSFLY
ncbi:hypothetical protein PRZ48_011954 [Zasmidium cellare]|uniref:BTB domain-containing protein n=1 Tax=Zasmidium cellare TaxID=395010 RepID=A0ABR0E8S5_ZASCE|nr:hypothetical protein PRZ48_011954 [Zasmidium cellare]